VGGGALEPQKSHLCTIITIIINSTDHVMMMSAVLRDPVGTQLHRLTSPSLPLGKVAERAFILFADGRDRPPKERVEEV